MRIRLWVITVVLAILATKLLPQDTTSPDFARFVDANEHFGRNLLRELHESRPESNIVVSPLPLSTSFAMFRNVSDTATKEELDGTFGWRNFPDLGASARKLTLQFGQTGKRGAEELWTRSVMSAVDIGRLSPRFRTTGTVDYGVIFRTATEKERPKEASNRSNFWMVSETHLGTHWSHNTFLRNRENGVFHFADGHALEIPMLSSETSRYRHFKNDKLEAVDLQSNTAYLRVIIPQGSSDVYSLETDSASSDSLLAEMTYETGRVEMPPLALRSHLDVKGSLQALGVNSIFDSWNLIAGALAYPGDGALLVSASQDAMIEVDEMGIRASAATTDAGIIGGTLGGPQPAPFCMIVNRPFLFFVRDNASNSLLFAGAVMDPTKP